MITISMPIERQEKVLKEAGYFYHPTQGKDGLTVYGYVRIIDDRCRWHALIGEDWLNIHQDKTVNGHHVLNWRMGIEKREKMRVSDIYRQIFPRHLDPTAMQIKGKGEFAPNLRELQRNHKTAIQSQDTEIQKEKELSPLSA